MSAPETNHASVQCDKLFLKYSAASTTRDSFSAIEDLATQMDITEFTRFARDFELTEVLPVAKLKMIFVNSNQGDSADDRRGYLNAAEFRVAVQTALERAHGEFERRGKPVNKGVLALESTLKEKPLTPRGKKSPKAKPATPSANEVISAQDSLPLDLLPESNFQSDGVRVPVSKLWGAIREVESHIQTEEQLKSCIDRITAQYKEELSRVEKQKAMAVAALERSENELLEYEKAAIVEVQKLTAEADQANEDRALAEQACEAMRAERAELTRKMKEEKKECDLKVKQARESEEEMCKLLNAGNLERDEVYEDARRMSTEKMEQRKRQEDSEAKLRAEMAALQERLEAEISKLLREREEADAAAASMLKQVRGECRDQVDQEMKRNVLHAEELQASHDAAMAALKADYEAQLLAAQERYKVLADKLNDSNTAHERRFAESEESNKGAADRLEAEMSALRAQLATTQAELARTKEAKDEAETRLQDEVNRVYEQLNEERERREAMAVKIAEVEADSLEKRQALQAELDESTKRALAAEESLAEAEATIASLRSEVEGLQTELSQANATIAELESLTEQLKGLLEESKQREAVLQDKYDAKCREMDETVRGLLSVSGDHEASAEQHKALLAQEQSEHGKCRESAESIQQALSKEQEAHRQRVAAHEEDRSQLHAEAALMKAEHIKASDGLRESHRLSTEAVLEEHAGQINQLSNQQRQCEEQLEKALRTTKGEVDRLVHEVTRLRNERDEAESKNRSFEKSIEQLDQHISEQQLLIEQARANLAASEEENKRLQQLIRDAEDAERAAQREHQAALEQLEASQAASTRELQAEHQREKEELSSQIHHLQGELSVLQALHKSANVSIDELEKQLAAMREELRKEEREHAETQNLLEAANEELKALKLEQAKLRVAEQECSARNSELAANVLQLEADKRMLELERNELNVEVERLKYEVARLQGLLEDANERCETVEQRKELVDRQLSEKMVEVDTLTVEVRTLEDTNAEIAAETHKAITSMTEEMEQLRNQFQAKISKLESDLRRVQMDRDELEASYQFAKDELQVIRTTLNSMEEGSKSVRYITEQPGNPTLVNRMNNEWDRVAGMPPPAEAPKPSPRASASPRNPSGFARDFRLAHSNLLPKKPVFSDAPKQGDLGGDHWKP